MALKFQADGVRNPARSRFLNDIRLPRINYVKSAVAGINLIRGSVKLFRGFLSLPETVPLAIGGIGTAPESGGVSLIFGIPVVISATEITGGAFLVNRGSNQLGEALSDPSPGHFQNLLGLLPFGSHFDDPGEFSTGIQRVRRLSFWQKIGKVSTF